MTLNVLKLKGIESLYFNKKMNFHLVSKICSKTKGILSEMRFVDSFGWETLSAE